MNIKDIELAIAKYFNYRQNIIVPNISWGLHLHECDLLVLSKSGYATEVEIKISKSDLIKDKFKKHKHLSDKIRRLFFAMPIDLYNIIKDDKDVMVALPKKAGIVVVYSNGRCEKIVRAKTVALARKFNDKEVQKLLHLGIMRTWNLRKTVRALMLENKKLTLTKEIR